MAIINASNPTYKEYSIMVPEDIGNVVQTRRTKLHKR